MLKARLNKLLAGLPELTGLDYALIGGLFMLAIIGALQSRASQTVPVFHDVTTQLR
jgi:hypothetical protein